jgi:GTP-binding protein HflX
VVGYTNAGKSTLLNAVSQANVLVENQLFATLDPTTRRVELPSGHVTLFTDTVGFIQKLPTTLVASFRATLEEINEADLLLHVVDASHPNADEQVTAVEEVLEELGAGDKPVITALNKVDLLDMTDPEVTQWLETSMADYPDAVAISALTGAGVDTLLNLIDERLRQEMVSVRLLIPYNHGDLVSLFHEYGHVESEDYTGKGTILEGRLPASIAGRLAEYWINDEADEANR